MTEKRLKEVLWDCTGMNTDNHPSIIEAMKQVVNEALEEVIANTDQFDHIHKDEILKLKVK